MTDEATNVVTTPSQQRRRSLSWRRYLRALRSPKGAVAVGVVLSLTVIAMAAPLIFPDGYDVQGPDTLAPPSPQHWFGTDEYGRDLLARSIYGLRTDLALVYIAVPITVVVGTVIGLLGFVSKLAGQITQRLLDIILGFPSLVLAISVVIVLGTGFVGLLTSIVILGLPTFARLARASLLEHQGREYVVAARTLGIGRGTIMVRHLLPNAVDAVIVQAVVFMVNAIFLESALSVVGLGIQPPEPSLGALINTGMRYVTVAPSYVMGPMLLIVVLAFALTALADSLNEQVTRR